MQRGLRSILLTSQDLDVASGASSRHGTSTTILVAQHEMAGEK
jgi:hypothetical protein